MLLGFSDREEDFDVLGPILWPVESYSPMGARVSSFTQGMLLALQRTRCIIINAFFGMTWIASIYGMCIQWRLYGAAWIWQLKVPLGIGRNLFCLTFLLWALCAVNSPRFRLLYKVPWEDNFPHLLALEVCRSSKFFHFPWTKNANWIMGITAEAKKTEV